MGCGASKVTPNPKDTAFQRVPVLSAAQAAAQGEALDGKVVQIVGRACPQAAVMHTPFGEVDCIAGELIGRINGHAKSPVTVAQRLPGKRLLHERAAAGAFLLCDGEVEVAVMASSEPNSKEWQCFFKSAFFEKDLRCDAERTGIVYGAEWSNEKRLERLKGKIEPTLMTYCDYVDCVGGRPAPASAAAFWEAHAKPLVQGKGDNRAGFSNNARYQHLSITMKDRPEQVRIFNEWAKGHLVWPTEAAAKAADPGFFCAQRSICENLLVEGDACAVVGTAKWDAAAARLELIPTKTAPLLMTNSEAAADALLKVETTPRAARKEDAASVLAPPVVRPWS